MSTDVVFLLTMWLLAASLVIAVAVLLLFTLWSSATLRNQPFRWLQSLAASAAIPEFLLQLSLYTPYLFFENDGLFTVPVVCYVGLPLVPALYWLLILAVIMTSAERQCSLVKRNVLSGFTKTQAFIAIFGSILVSLISSFSITYGLGLISWRHTGDGNYVCYDMYSAIPIITICLAVVLMIQAILLSAFLIKTRAGAEATHPLDNVLPIIFGDILLAASLLLDAHCWSLGLHGVYLDTLLLPFTMVVWLLGDGAVRRSFLQICCSLCRSQP